MSVTRSYPWKQFKVDLESLHAYLQFAISSYAGMSAADQMSIHFSQAPTDQQVGLIEQHLNAMTEQGEAAKIEYRQKLERVVEHARLNLPYVDFGTMLIAEKKLFLGQALTLSDRETLLEKYPNV